MVVQEKYDCPKSLDAAVIRFPSLQCEMRACRGFIVPGMGIEDFCRTCEHYYGNVVERDSEKVDRPL